MMPALRRRDGFALPITIFLVTFITLMLAAIVVRVQADRQVAESSGDMVDALGVAQTGLQRYLGTQTFRPRDGDSVRINVTGGYADVVVYTVQKPADTLLHQMFLVRSTGYVIEPAMGATPQASRTVAQFAEWQVGSMDLIGAFTAANGVRRPGGSQGNGTIDLRGADQCGSDPPVAGLRIPSGPDPGPAGISGSPPVLEADNGSTVALQTGVDWAATIGGGFVPDYTYFRAWDATYPSMLISGDLSRSNTGGYGLLIVTGDLTLAGSYFIWYGIVLVGGRIEFNASYNYFYGAVISGLNEQLQGKNPQRGEIGRTGKYTRIWHTACAKNAALQSLTGFVPITNAWVDEWATY